MLGKLAGNGTAAPLLAFGRGTEGQLGTGAWADSHAPVALLEGASLAACGRFANFRNIAPVFWGEARVECHAEATTTSITQ